VVFCAILTKVRLVACEDMLHIGMAQDECWDSLDPSDRKSLNKFWNIVAPEESGKQNRVFENYAPKQWDRTVSRATLTFDAMSELRLSTTINNSALRREACAKFPTAISGRRRKSVSAGSPSTRDNGHARWRYPISR
jgi:hypothetical protein